MRACVQWHLACCGRVGRACDSRAARVCAVPPPRTALHPAALSCAPCDTVHTHPAKHRPTAAGSCVLWNHYTPRILQCVTACCLQSSAPRRLLRRQPLAASRVSRAAPSPSYRSSASASSRIAFLYDQPAARHRSRRDGRARHHAAHRPRTMCAPPCATLIMQTPESRRSAPSGG
jgi:hypothetical protein